MERGIERFGGEMLKRPECSVNREIEEISRKKMATFKKNKFTSTGCDDDSVNKFCENKFVHTDKDHYQSRSRGAIHHCVDFKYCSDKEILDGLKEQKVIGIERTTRPDTGEEGDTYYLTFEQAEVPKYILAGYERHEIHEILTEERGEEMENKNESENERKEEKKKKKKRNRKGRMKKGKKEEKSYGGEEKEDIIKENKQEEKEGKPSATVPEGKREKTEEKEKKTDEIEEKKKEKRKGKKNKRKNKRSNTEEERLAGRVKFKGKIERLPQHSNTAMQIEAGNVKVKPPENK